MLILLLASGQLQRVAGMLGYSESQVRRLPAAVHMVRKSARLREQFGEAVLNQILPSVMAIPVIQPVADLDLLDTLNAVVDPGEAQLMAIAATQACTLLASGDKRAVRALAGSAGGCVAALQGRLVTLEAVLWLLVSAIGSSATRDAFSPVQRYTTLRVVLSEHAAVHQAQCLDAIRSAYNEIHREAAGMLYNPAPDELGLN